MLSRHNVLSGFFAPQGPETCHYIVLCALSNLRGKSPLPQAGPVASHRHHFGLFAVSEHLIEAWFASFRNQKLTFPSRKVRHGVLNVDTLGIPSVHVVDVDEHLLMATTLSARSEVMIIANNFAHYKSP